MTHHDLDPSDAAAMTALRGFLAANPTAMTRALYDQLLEQIPDLDGVRYEPGVVGGVPGVWCRPAAARTGASLLYLHGGAYVFGSAHAYRHFAGQLAGRAHLDTFVVDYRLAPEHRFPAAVDDARAAFLAMPGAIAVAGDSAGSGLAMALLAPSDPAATRPVAGILFSPWLDLALTGDSVDTADDPLLTRADLAHGATAYMHGHDLRDPRASPLYGELAGLPPVQIHVGTAEILLDDARRLAARAPSELHVWDGMPHVFPRNVRTLVAARAALALCAEFIDRALESDARNRS